MIINASVFHLLFKLLIFCKTLFGCGKCWNYFYFNWMNDHRQGQGCYLKNVAFYIYYSQKPRLNIISLRSKSKMGSDRNVILFDTTSIQLDFSLDFVKRAKRVKFIISIVQCNCSLLQYVIIYSYKFLIFSDAS